MAAVVIAGAPSLGSRVAVVTLGEATEGTIMAVSSAEPWAPFYVVFDNGTAMWTDLRGGAWQLLEGRIEVPEVDW